MCRALLFACAAIASALVAREVRAQQPSADAPSYSLTGTDLGVSAVGATSVVPLGCTGKSLARLRDRLVVACGRDGIVTLDLSDPAHPKVIDRNSAEGDAVSVFVLDDRLWVRSVRDEARPLDTMPRSAATTPAPVNVAPPPPVNVAPPPPPPRAVDVPPPQPEKRVSVMAPPRRGNLTELSLSGLAFLNIGPVGGGALFDASVVHRFDLPLFIGAFAEPAGFGAGKQDRGTPLTVGALTGYAMAGMDSQWIEAGLGAGAATTMANGSAVMLVTRGRIGAHDGVHFRWIMGISAVQDRFELGELGFGMQIPLDPRWALQIDGVGGITRADRGLVGVRYRISGDGGPGTLEITGSTGFAIVQQQSAMCTYVEQPVYQANCTGANATYGGPALGIGIGGRI